MLLLSAEFFLKINVFESFFNIISGLSDQILSVNMETKCVHLYIC